ncbi:MAG TPA: uroporphyrinogen decarboxylase family protein, partial [Spirochaetia bacterium]|nr:uroporphyrinogen decarboxylase family protein [Spirochaetia bacterium]
LDGTPILVARITDRGGKSSRARGRHGRRTASRFVVRREREKLKKELGNRVIFHGAVENQKVLPFGSPEEVAAEVRENIRILGAGGGYICAPCHNIQAGTPIENILALFRTVNEG